MVSSLTETIRGDSQTQVMRLPPTPQTPVAVALEESSQVSVVVTDERVRPYRSVVLYFTPANRVWSPKGGEDNAFLKNVKLIDTYLFNEIGTKELALIILRELPPEVLQNKGIESILKNEKKPTFGVYYDWSHLTTINNYLKRLYSTYRND